MKAPAHRHVRPFVLTWIALVTVAAGFADAGGTPIDFDPDRVLFLSLHADSRHSSLRGVMVYVPGAAAGTPSPRPCCAATLACPHGTRRRG